MLPNIIVPLVEAPATLGTVPTAFRLFHLGTNTTADKVDFILTKESMAEIIQNWKDHGTQLSIDYEHSSTMTTEELGGKPAPSAGWFDLEARQDGLWAVNVRWVPAATEMLKNGEYKYYSPTFRAKGPDKIINTLVCAALTNLPRLDDLTPLVNCKDTEEVLTASLTSSLISSTLLNTHEVLTSAKDTRMDLQEHADLMKEHMACMKEHMASMKDMKKEEAKEAPEAMDGDKEDKAKSELEDQAAAKAKLASDAVLLAKERTFGMLDAAMSGTNPKLTPGEVKEFKAKVEAGTASEEYIGAFITAKNPIAGAVIEAKVEVDVTSIFTAAQIAVMKERGDDIKLAAKYWKENLERAKLAI